ncbi:chromatin assembly factor 1 subunit A-B-like [Daphnia pulex]|uniref:chromatin assembly factor 1 subunit A-B-like n=1 Tax=Daphnia pulex TaxID=6669 RepID=UPI001EDE21A2|nr:chromatin assembly factor 1 subunit A-B-like [Daphnia pulex]
MDKVENNYHVLGKTLPDQASTEISYGRSFKTFPLVADDYFAVSIPNASMAGADQESELDVSCVSNDELGKTLPDRYKPSADMSKAAEVTGTGINMAKSPKCYLLVDYSSSDESDASMDDSGKTRPDKTSTPRKEVKGKKRPALSQEEKKEKERQIAEKKAERERLRKEKKEEKKKKEEERETEKKKREEEKKKKEEEKEAERKKKEEEKSKKEEIKETERKRKEEEKKRKEEEKRQNEEIKEAERKRKEEEKKRKEVEKENAKKIKEDEERRKKENFAQKYVKHAPVFRTEFDTSRKKYLEQILKKSDSEPSVDLNLRQYRENKGRSYGATWPIKDNDVGVIDEDEAKAPINNETIVTIVHPVPHRMRPKLVQFWENRRPAYWGTWRKSSYSVGPRRPFGKEIIFDYDVDSDDEWEEEVEPGESLTDSEGEGEEKEPADDYEVDNEFLVPHGYLSDDEGEKDEDERALSTSAAKEKLKLKEEQFERELKKKTCYIKPSLIGCCWSDDFNPNPQHLKVLERYAPIVLSSTLPIELKSEGEESDDNINKKSTKRLVNEKDIPDLIRVLHGSLFGRSTIVQEFQLHLERNRAGQNQNGPSKAQILAKISEIASYSRCTEAGAMSGKICWLVQPSVLEHYNLAELSVINAWEFATDTKKRGRKTDDSEEDTPLAKIPRVSPIKEFDQPASLPANRVSSSQENELSESGKDSNVPAKQPIFSTPKGKKTHLVDKSPNICNQETQE